MTDSERFERIRQLYNPITSEQTGCARIRPESDYSPDPDLLQKALDELGEAFKVGTHRLDVAPGESDNMLQTLGYAATSTTQYRFEDVYQVDLLTASKNDQSSDAAVSFIQQREPSSVWLIQDLPEEVKLSKARLNRIAKVHGAIGEVAAAMIVTKPVIDAVQAPIQLHNPAPQQDLPVAV